MSNPTSRGQLQMDGFFAKSDHRAACITVALGGNADMAVQDKFKAFLDELATTAEATRAREVVFDWRELYFMNSSCLSLLLRFMNRVLELSEPQRYKLKFISNPNLKWQAKSLQALQAYAKELVVVE